MRKKFITLLLASILIMSGCGNTQAPGDTAPEISETSDEENDNSPTQEDAGELEATGDIEVEEELFDVELTIPAEFVGETTQEEFDQIAKENRYKSITLNSDGSATYVMTKSQHKEMMNEMADKLNSLLNDLIGSEDYPNFTDIEANSDFTSFTITTSSTELDVNESFSVIVFYMYGGMYNTFNGTPVDNIHIDFVNSDTGNIIESADSKDMDDTE